MYKANQEQLEKESQSEGQALKTTAEDEFLKRNTDCVYFLASPLTCKKGSECEYRHSEVARVNPRDCWFWLNGNCLNLKCGFRHPPLDGLLATQKPTAVGHAFPPSQNILTPAEQAFQVPAKQAVPCIFFQQGYCLKGDMCPFMHAPYSSNNKVSQLAAATPVTESQPNKKTFGGLQKSAQEQKDLHNKIQKSVELPVQAKSVRKTEMAGKSARRSNHSHQVDIQDNQSVLNGKDVDEFSRDPSPGFDVLVNGEVGETDYYHNDNLYGGTRGHEGRNLNPLKDYELDRPSDYHSMADVGRDVYNDPPGYDSYDHRKGNYRQEQRISSDRMLGGSARLARGRRSIADSTDRTDRSDLRHHLLKQKRGDGLRSVVTHDRVREYRADDRIYRPPQRDHTRARESVLSSRLRGRIQIPGGSTSHGNKTGSSSERETEKDRHMGRLSTERLQGRLKERMKGRLYEDLDNEDRSIRSGSDIRHEPKGNVNENDVRFSGPKSLSELKSKKSGSNEQHVNDQQLLGKRKFPKLDGAPQQGEGISFEGPKPLSEILKKKRGVASADNESGNDDHQEANKKLLTPIDAKISNSVSSSLLKEEVSLVEKNEKPKGASTDIKGAEEKVKSALGQPSLPSETEEGLIGDETMEDQEPEAYEQTEGYYDYEQGDGEDYNLEEGEHLDPDDEYYDEEDDADDFAKKMGVTFS